MYRPFCGPVFEASEDRVRYQAPCNDTACVTEAVRQLMPDHCHSRIVPEPTVWCLSVSVIP